MGELLIRMVFSLAVVVGLLILISRIAARRLQGRSGSPIEVLHRQGLSKSASVAVVSVAGRVLVLGTTDQQVTVLTELDPADLETADLETADLDPADLEAADDDASVLPGAPAYDALAAPAATDELPSLEALLAEPDLVTLEELFGHRPPAPASPAFDTAPYDPAPAAPVASPAATALLEEDPILPEDPSYAAFASQLRAQLASGAHAEPAPAAAVAPTPGRGRHAAPAPALEMPPSQTGGARAARTVEAPAPAPSPTPAAPAAAAPSVSGPTAADIAALRAALLSAQLQAAGSTGAPTAVAAPGGRPARAERATRLATDGPLSGSVLSPQTWRQAIRAVNRRAS